MSTVEQIEVEIGSLPGKAQWSLMERLHDRLWDTWDNQIESDAKAGYLDHLISEVELDIAEGQVKPLDEILDNS